MIVFEGALMSSFTSTFHPVQVVPDIRYELVSSLSAVGEFGI